MRDLSGDRPLFHSESDFQHEIAWRIRQAMPDCGLRLEYPAHSPSAGQLMYLGLWLEGVDVAIELKHRTRKLDLEIDSEVFSLRNQSANDCARYDFLKDIWRLENLSCAKTGFAIFLTNDPLYWEKPRNPSATVDSEFRLHDSRRLGGEMAWSEQASDGTRKGRKQPIRLKGSYKARWGKYGDAGHGRYSELRYLVIKVPP